MLQGNELLEIAGRLPLAAYHRKVFRAVELKALISVNPIQPLYDLGPGESGQRYTAIGGPKALYVAESPSRTYFESTGLASSVKALAEQSADITAIINIETKLDAILELTNPAIQAMLKTTTVELTLPWRWKMAAGQPVLTHILADAIYLSGKFQAMRFPAAKATDEANLVIWTETLSGNSFVESVDLRFPQRIPPNFSNR
jgi:hypothetical protein